MKTAIIKAGRVLNVVDGEYDLPLNDNETKIEFDDDEYIGVDFRMNEQGEWIPPADDYGWIT